MSAPTVDSNQGCDSCGVPTPQGESYGITELDGAGEFLCSNCYLRKPGLARMVSVAPDLLSALRLFVRAFDGDLSDLAIAKLNAQLVIKKATDMGDS
jgi:hypothetical protein